MTSFTAHFRFPISVLGLNRSRLHWEHLLWPLKKAHGHREDRSVRRARLAEVCCGVHLHHPAGPRAAAQLPGADHQQPHRLRPQGLCAGFGAGFSSGERARKGRHAGGFFFFFFFSCFHFSSLPKKRKNASGEEKKTRALLRSCFLVLVGTWGWWVLVFISRLRQRKPTASFEVLIFTLAQASSPLHSLTLAAHAPLVSSCFLGAIVMAPQRYARVEHTSLPTWKFPK